MKRAYVIYERLEWDSVSQPLLPSRYMLSGDYEGEDRRICETLFKEWNNAVEGVTGQKSGPLHVRSMSVGDRVLLQEGQEERSYLCDPAGFRLEGTAPRADLEKALPQVKVTFNGDPRSATRFHLTYKLQEMTIEVGASQEEEAFHALAAEARAHGALKLDAVLRTYECGRCHNSHAAGVLGGGGDYETHPCPDCRPLEYRRAIDAAYSSPVDTEGK